LPPHFDFAGRGTFGVAWVRGRTLSTPARAFVELLLQHDAELHRLERELAQSG
jgi:hypothetical protein